MPIAIASRLRTRLALAAALSVLPVVAAAQSAQAPIRYTLSVPAPATHLTHATAAFPTSSKRHSIS